MDVFLFAVALVFVGQAYPDRAKFLRDLKALPDQAPSAEVIRVLGKPDRVSSHGAIENGQSTTYETWYYGTDDKGGAATLAELSIYNGHLAYHPVSSDPPSTKVISEVELRRGMHIVLDRFPPTSSSSNEETAKWVAKSVNGLLPFGEAKCKAIISECGRITENSAQLCPWLYFLTYSLFDPPKPPGYFDGSKPVWVAPLPDNKRLQFPRWPVEIVNNMPVIHGGPIGVFGGYAPDFATVYPTIRDRIHLRKALLKVPD